MPKRKRTSSTSTAPRNTEPRKRRAGTRHATIYDAVASRVNYEGFVHPRLTRDASGGKNQRSQKAMPADEVLGRRRNAPDEPIPYGEAEELGLPDSDLLIAVHQYAADFYGANGMGPVSYRSLDETALLAVGMLLEETVRACLGDNGDLVLIEQEEREDNEVERKLINENEGPKVRIPKYHDR